MTRSFQSILLVLCVFGISQCLSQPTLVMNPPTAPGGLMGGKMDGPPQIEDPEDQTGPMPQIDFEKLINNLQQLAQAKEISEVNPLALDPKEKRSKRIDTVKERVATLADKDANKKAAMIHSMLHEIVAVAHDASQGLRFQDHYYVVSSKDKKLSEVFEYFDGKGNWTNSPPKTKEYSTQVTRKLALISSLYCEVSKSMAQDKASLIHPFCQLANELLDAMNKVLSGPGFSAKDGVNALKAALAAAKPKYPDIMKVLDNSDEILVELESRAGITAAAAAKYKIAPLGSHHESIACQSLRPNLLNLGAGFTTPTGKTVARAFDEAVSANTWCDWGVAPSARFWDVNANNLYYLKLGARWQDVPCQGSDNPVFRDGFVDTCYARGVPAAAWGARIILDNSLAIRSHETDGTHWHSMTSAQTIASLPGKQRQSDFREKIVQQALDWLDQAVNFQVGGANAFDRKRFFWNLGRTCHMLADSYSCSHVARAANNHKVLWFQDYVTQLGDGAHHGRHDSTPTPGVSAGTVKALQDCTAVGVIYATVARDHLDNVVGCIPNAQAALRQFLEQNVYMFYNGQDNVGARSCCVGSTCRPGGKQCPMPANAPAPGFQICADNPVDIATELH